MKHATLIAKIVAVLLIAAAWVWLAAAVQLPVPTDACEGLPPAYGTDC